MLYTHAEYAEKLCSLCPRSLVCEGDRPARQMCLGRCDFCGCVVAYALVTESVFGKNYLPLPPLQMASFLRCDYPPGGRVRVEARRLFDGAMLRPKTVCTVQTKTLCCAVCHAKLHDESYAFSLSFQLVTGDLLFVNPARMTAAQARRAGISFQQRRAALRRQRCRQSFSNFKTKFPLHYYQFDILSGLKDAGIVDDASSVVNDLLGRKGKKHGR